MKRLFIILPLLLVVALFSCSVDDSDDNYQTADNSKLNEKITLKATPDEDNKLSFSIKSSAAMVDWGDGKKSNTTSEVQVHQYKDRALRTIVIKANSLTSFSKEATTQGSVSDIEFESLPNLRTIQCESQGLVSFKFTNIPLLEDLLLADNKLTSLDVSRFPKVKQVDISYNNFTKEAINSLFSSLPVSAASTNNAPVVLIDTDVTGYDLSIAQKRGWDVLFVPYLSENE